MADGTVKIDVILSDGKVGKGIAKVDKSLGGLNGAAKKVSVSIGSIVKSLGLVALASKGIDMVTQSLSGAIDRYDTLNNFPRVMQQMGFDASESEGAINKLSDGIQGLPTTLDSVASTAQRIAILTGDLDGATDTTLALNDAFLASGASSADAERGLEQYVQMLSKGEVDLQSWRTLQETMGVALNDVAKAFGFTGKAAQNDLYDALKSGEITFDEFNGKLIELDTAQGGFAERAKTASGGIKTAYTNMKTAVVRGVTSIIESIDGVLSKTPLKSIENILNQIGNAFNNVLTFIAEGIPIAVEFIMGLADSIRGLFGPTDEFKQSLIDTVNTVIEFFAPAFEAVFTFVKEIFMQLVEFFQTHGPMISEAIQNVMTVIMAIMQFIWPAIQFLIVDTWNAIKNIIQGALDVILGIIQFFSALFTGNWTEMWEAVKQIFSGALELVWGLINLWFIGKILKAGKAFAKGFKQIFTSLWTAIKSLFTASVNAVKNIVQAGFNLIRSVISGIMNGIKSVISSIWNVIKSVFRGAVNGVKSVVNGGFNAIRSVISTIMNAIRSVITSIWNAIKGVVRSVVNAIKSVVSGGFRGMVNAIKNSMSSALSAVKNIFTNMLNVGKNAGKMFLGIGKDLVRGLINGIKNMAGAAIDAITGVVGGVVDKAKSLLSINSPSKLFRQFGEWTSEGLSIGIDDEAKQAFKSSKNLAKGVSDSFDSDVNSGFKNRLRGLTAPINTVLPKSLHVTQSVINKQARANDYDDSRVVQLLKQLVDKDGNIYIEGEKLGTFTDKEQARRINLRGRRVAID